MSVTDDELVTTANEVLRHFDRQEAECEFATRLKEWALSIFVWDGLLPAAVVSIPMLASAVFPDQVLTHVVLNVTIPIIAFFARLVVGQRYFDKRPLYGWQAVVFLLAILYLVFLEALLILFDSVDIRPAIDDWQMLGGLYLFYLSAMGIALFPFPAIWQTREDNGTIDQRPWDM